LRAQLVKRDRHCRPVKSGFSPRDDVALSGSVQYDLDPFHRTILLKSHHGVNRAPKPRRGQLDGELGAASQPRRKCRVMCVKNYLH
jgi:hypothetical protein